MDVVVRRIQMSDMAAVVEVHSRAFVAAHRGLIPEAMTNEITLAVVREYWERNLATGAVGLVAVSEGIIQGTALGGRIRGQVETAGLYELYALYVSPDQQRKGVGRKLWTRFSEQMRKDGACRIAIHVVDGNPAVRFYESLGAVLTQKKERLVSGGVVEDLMYEVQL